MLIITKQLQYLGFTGMITWDSNRAEGVQEVVKATPLERILLETDGPYMTPEPSKAVCHSGHIPLIASKIAELKSVTLDAVLLQTRINTKACYGI
jgi:TatD DNase family protein